LLGADYYIFNNYSQINFSNNFGQIALFGPPVPPTPPSGIYPNLSYIQQNDNVGAYAQDQIDLPYGFHVLAGARYNYISSRLENGNNPSGINSFDTLTVPALTQKSLTVDQRVTPRAGLIWRPIEWVSLYGSYVQSYSPNYTGGTLVLNTNEAPPPSAGQQEEAGVKFELLDKKLQISADYFHLIKTNVPLSIPNSTYVSLVGEERSQGPELDIQGELLPGWKMNLAYANIDAIVTKSTSGSSAAPVGSPIPWVPRNQGSISSNYEFKEGVLKGLKLGARYDYAGDIPFYHFDNVGSYIYGYGTPSYGLVGLFAGYEFKANGMTVRTQLNVDNLFDKMYFTKGGFGFIPNYYPGSSAPSIQPGWGGAWTSALGAPRTIRGSIKVSF
jgi:iron complex outermembrane receptor protein